MAIRATDARSTAVACLNFLSCLCANIYYMQCTLHAELYGIRCNRIGVRASYVTSYRIPLPNYPGTPESSHNSAIAVVRSRLSLANRNRDFKKKIVGYRNRNIFPVGTVFFCDFNAFYEQHLNCVFRVHAIRKVHDYFIIVIHTLHLSTKNIIMCFSDKRLLLFTEIVTATIFVYK